MADTSDTVWTLPSSNVSSNDWDRVWLATETEQTVVVAVDVLYNFLFPIDY